MSVLIRITASILLAAATLALYTVGASAKALTCHGKTATQWLAAPGTLYYTEGDYVFVGSSGDDKFLFGADGGTDTVCGGPGNDQFDLVRDPGSIADGGQGDDTISVAFGAVGYGGSGNDSISADYATGYGGSSNDEMHGYHSGAFVDGGSGVDTIYVSLAARGEGGSGNDILAADSNSWADGSSGDDTLTSDYDQSWAAERLYGNSGNDTLISEGGNPLLDCCSGSRDVVTPNGATQVHRCETII